MASMIIRIFETAAQGMKVAQHLRDEGYDDVFQFTRSDGPGESDDADRRALIEGMLRAHVWKSHAESYADRLAQGGSLVLVHAPFGSAVKAELLMDDHAPIGTGIKEEREPEITWDDAAPLSSALRMPVLTRVELPVETLSGVPSLTHGPAFLSNLFGLPLLSRGTGGKSSSFGLPLLSGSTTSSRLGLPLLWQNPTPLSSLLRLPVLKK